MNTDFDSSSRLLFNKNPGLLPPEIQSLLIQCRIFQDGKDHGHLPVFNGFMKVRLDCATGTTRFVRLFDLELGVLYAKESKINYKAE